LTPLGVTTCQLKHYIQNDRHLGSAILGQVFEFFRIVTAGPKVDSKETQRM